MPSCSVSIILNGAMLSHYAECHYGYIISEVNPNVVILNVAFDEASKSFYYTECCYAGSHFAESHYAECHHGDIISVIKSNVVILNVVAPIAFDEASKSFYRRRKTSIFIEFFYEKKTFFFLQILHQRKFSHK